MSVHLGYPAAIEVFRDGVREYLHAQLPPGWFDGDRPAADAWPAFCDSWNHMLHATGWATPTWPERFGGRGLDVLHAAVFAEEVAPRRSADPATGRRRAARRARPILHLGTDEQRERYLSPIARAEEVWCQGFSEPGSGSDLASLRTSARIEGDELVVDGHKIWTSQAQDADLMFLLVRTDPDTVAHRGISYVLLDMHQPGVDVRSIAQPDGTAGFAEVLLEGARCPLARTSSVSCTADGVSR